jgi:peroxiredoxin family protein/TusA-related sulfurtransferase
MQKGYDETYNMLGGYMTWENATLKQSNEDISESYMIDKDDYIYQAAAKKTATDESIGDYIDIDARGMQCPGPIIRLNDEIKDVPAGKVVRVIATDPGFLNDIKSWCHVTANELLKTESEKGEQVAFIKKSLPGEVKSGVETVAVGSDKTIVVFNDDMDKALAAFVIANGALAMGRKVTLFFTFWGLNILKKKRPVKVEKDFISRMFSLMLPSGSDKLKLSKLNMFGMGGALMKKIMKKKNIEGLDELMKKALDSGVRIIACQMSMDVMGIKKEELIDGIEVGGVASYIEASENSNLNLFI